MMIRSLLIALVMFVVTACTTPPAPPPDPVARLLEAGEVVTLRMPAQLLHGHDMQDQAYDLALGYKPIPTYEGELVLTDRRLLFVESAGSGAPSSLSVPYAAVARARPSPTPLLDYLVIWDAEGHADSFAVQGDVRALHRQFGEALRARTPGAHVPSRHGLTGNR